MNRSSANTAASAVVIHIGDEIIDFPGRDQPVGQRHGDVAERMTFRKSDLTVMGLLTGPPGVAFLLREKPKKLTRIALPLSSQT
jgi:hypothetical protein